MCTLTYLPLGNGEYIITSNRDESPQRAPATPPVRKNINGRQILCPVDGLAGGTWLAAAETGRVACLLNGGIGQHRHRPPYRLSRGLVLLESLGYAHADDFSRKYPLEGIEPFTLVHFSEAIRELKWDGAKKHLRDYAAGEPLIWSSPQLYKPEIIAKREQWFATWLARGPAITVEGARQFHRFGGEGDVYNDILMNRGGRVKTVSITSVHGTGKSVEMVHEDLLSGQSHRAVLPRK